MDDVADDVAAPAMLPANRVIAAEHARLSPLPPEGASVIMHRTVDRADEMAGQQHVGATDLLAEALWTGSCRLVPERPDAADEPVEFCRRPGQVVRHELSLPASSRESHRARRLRRGDHLTA